MALQQPLLVPGRTHLILGGPKIPINGGTPPKEDFLAHGTFILRDPEKDEKFEAPCTAIGFLPLPEHGGPTRDVTGLTPDGRKFRARYNPGIQRGLEFQVTG
ncbi:MAG: hypothetical protein A2925_01685 [Candidatus Yanofskybacteria bacterium RIFCSPLOWO2_01_FULL_44_22]|uniref:Uncharacterized protein n=1 Tax=Candidatus Yanofskybacteria bacterium RIFCSPLOWO2_01_FULL_44_22 TaxID=1802697 RepID=A0A1F8GNP0_9BACT|nr:MAG: hypothetical protein A2925_01685 [Candidatus Yanofskybacteria bacterium RIFCSPLOWO2_01_FULL_44_22]